MQDPQQRSERGRAQVPTPIRVGSAAKMRLNLHANASRIGRIFAVNPFNFIISISIYTKS